MQEFRTGASGRPDRAGRRACTDLPDSARFFLARVPPRLLADRADREARPRSFRLDLRTIATRPPTADPPWGRPWWSQGVRSQTMLSQQTSWQAPAPRGMRSGSREESREDGTRW